MSNLENRSVGRPTVHDEASLNRKIDAFITEGFGSRLGYISVFAKYAGISTRQLRRKKAILMRLHSSAQSENQRIGSTFWL
jgi:hypothetical protein